MNKTALAAAALIPAAFAFAGCSSTPSTAPSTSPSTSSASPSTDNSSAPPTASQSVKPYIAPANAPGYCAPLYEAVTGSADFKVFVAKLSIAQKKAAEEGKTALAANLKQLVDVSSLPSPNPSQQAAAAAAANTAKTDIVKDCGFDPGNPQGPATPGSPAPK